jgi:hypothetical protein
VGVEGAFAFEESGEPEEVVAVSVDHSVWFLPKV